MLRLTAAESAIMEKSLGEKLARSKIAVKKLQSSTLRLVYPDLGNPGYLKVIVYGDATHANLPSGASQGAQIVFFCVVIIRLFQSCGN